MHPTFTKSNQTQSVLENPTSERNLRKSAESAQQAQPQQHIVVQPQRKKFRFHDPPEVHSRPRAHKKRTSASELAELKRKKQQTSKNVVMDLTADDSSLPDKSQVVIEQNMPPVSCSVDFLYEDLFRSGVYFYIYSSFSFFLSFLFLHLSFVILIN